MPGVTVIPSSPTTLYQDHQSGPSGSRNVMSVAEIKESATRNVKVHARGASVLSLLKTARNQAIQGYASEREGDLKGALKALWTAAQLTSTLLGSAEGKAELDKKGELWKEFVDFQQQYGNELIPRTKRLEARLTDIETSKPISNTSDDNERPKSIADRMRSLQDAGLSVQPNKRVSRDLSSHLPPPVSRAASSQTPTSPTVSSPPPNQHIFVAPALSSSLTDSSVHSFVSPSSFGPPSPTSSASSSPQLHNLNISEFSKVFPSIDELDGLVGHSGAAALLELPSVPSTEPGAVSLGSSIKAPRPLPSPPSIVSRFPSLPLDLDPGPRPASTPIPPTANITSSSPPSPTSGAQSPSSAGTVQPSLLSPKSSTVPLKQSSLGMGVNGIPTERLNLEKTNIINSRRLHEVLSKHGVRVLLLDVRTRDEFSREHIKGDAVVCLDPYVLVRDGLTGEQLEDSLSVAPQEEYALFRNRDKFDLVVLYDGDSETYGPAISPMSAAVRIIYETAFRRALKRNPVLLVGGLRAWKSVYPAEVTSDVETGVDRTFDDLMQRSERLKLTPSPGSSSSHSGTGNNVVNGVVTNYVTNGVNSINSINGMTDTSSHEIWMPMRPRSGTDASSTSSIVGGSPDQSWVRSQHGMNQIPEHESTHSERDDVTNSPDSSRKLSRKPALVRPASSSSMSFGARPLYDTTNTQSTAQFSYGSQMSLQPTGSASIQYPQGSRMTSNGFGTSLNGYASPTNLVSLPPQASINPSPLSRRRSDLMDQSEHAMSTLSARPSIDYPDLSARHVVRPPPAAATPPLERQDNRPRMTSHVPSFYTPAPPTIKSDYPVVYWSDMQIATSGLKNLGNTCYMNATIQCLSATVPFSRFFTDGRWKSAVNMLNPLGSKGQLTMAFASILHDLWYEEPGTISPYTFRRSICLYAKQFAGSEQHDSQEFLSFLLDGLHEDLNRVLNKPSHEVTPEREAELEMLQQQIASEQEWAVYRMRNDSIVVDFFQGQFRNRMECMTCKKTSTTYNAFMYLTLPIPTGRGTSKLSLQQCLDVFVKEEVMDKSDAWHCPNCKALRKATKHLSLSRLPPVLLIHLKRFSFKGPFTDKLEAHVDFPLTGLDLTNYMPPPLPPGERKSNAPVSMDDPRTQLPPYRYDLYGVTNHFGTLSSGHYTAFVKSRGNWVYCDDSRITTADAKEVVGKPAYVLFYKRTQP